MLSLFQPDCMYYWARSEPILQSLDIIPQRLSHTVWPPTREEAEAAGIEGGSTM